MKAKIENFDILGKEKERLEQKVKHENERYNKLYF